MADPIARLPAPLRRIAEALLDVWGGCRIGTRRPTCVDQWLVEWPDGRRNYVDQATFSDHYDELRVIDRCCLRHGLIASRARRP